MAKKTFKDSVASPADRFFNTGAAVDAKPAGKPAAAESTHNTADTQYTQYTHKEDSPGEQQRKSKLALAEELEQQDRALQAQMDALKKAFSFTYWEKA